MRTRTILAGAAVAATVLLCGAGAGPAAAATCYGAPAHAPVNPCVNTSKTFTPTVAGRNAKTESPCIYRVERGLSVCIFGKITTKPKKNIALIGDSHSWHWRAAIDYVAKKRGWLGQSVTSPGCPFYDAVKYMPVGFQSFCKGWFTKTRAWLVRHKEVSTVFVSQLNSSPINPPAGKTVLDVRVSSFKRAWVHQMPKSVKRIVILSDVPKPRFDIFTCLTDALASSSPDPGLACSTPRAEGLLPDVAGLAAKQLHSPRYQYIDLTKYFCDDTNCPAVIGGSLVFRDNDGHITPAFAGSFGPILQSKVR